MKICNYFKNMVQSISQELRLKNIDEIKNNFLEEIKQNELMSTKHNKVFPRTYAHNNIFR